MTAPVRLVRVLQQLAERLRDPASEPEQARPDQAPPAVTGNARAFRVLVRNALFRRVELAALRRYNDLGEGRTLPVRPTQVLYTRPRK